MTDTPPSTPARLQMRGVRKRFGATVALDGVDFTVAAGEVHALVGENGAGKSTLMKVLSGAIQPDDGSMELDGQPYRPRQPHDARLAGVAMIYQELSLAPHLSVADNVLLGMEPVTLGLLRRRKMRHRAKEALQQLGHADIRPGNRVGDLSIAQQQLVEIARAVAIGCRVLVLDEPTSSLTRDDAERLFALIARLKQEGHAIIYISHFIEEVKRVADNFTVLRDGQSVGGGRVAETTTDQIITLMVGRKLEQLYVRSHSATGTGAGPTAAVKFAGSTGIEPSGAPLLAIHELAGVSKPLVATLALYPGEVLGIAGLIGAGRTELLRVIFGLDRVKRGTIKVAAFVGPASPTRRWAQGVGLLSEDRKAEGLAMSMSVADNITLSSLGVLVAPNRQATDTQKWIERLNVRCRDPHQRVSGLSGGNQQKIALARLLHHDVDVLLLDEPTRGIDVASKAQIYQLIDKLAGMGKAVLLVSSYLPELLGVCDRIAVMHRGTLGAPRPVSQCDEQKLLLEATGLYA